MKKQEWLKVKVNDTFLDGTNVFKRYRYKSNGEEWKGNWAYFMIKMKNVLKKW